MEFSAIKSPYKTMTNLHVHIIYCPRTYNMNERQLSLIDLFVNLTFLNEIISPWK